MRWCSLTSESTGLDCASGWISEQDFGGSIALKNRYWQEAPGVCVLGFVFSLSCNSPKLIIVTAISNAAPRRGKKGPLAIKIGRAIVTLIATATAAR